MCVLLSHQNEPSYLSGPTPVDAPQCNYRHQAVITLSSFAFISFLSLIRMKDVVKEAVSGTASERGWNVLCHYGLSLH